MYNQQFREINDLIFHFFRLHQFLCAGPKISETWSISSNEFNYPDNFLKARSFNDFPMFPTNMNDSNKRQSFKCNLCGKDYWWISNLRRHQLQCGNKEAKINCNFCTKKFYRRDKLKKHLFANHNIISQETKTLR